MVPDAADSRSKYHCNRVTAIVYHITGYMVLIGASIALLLGAPFTRLYYSVPYSVAVSRTRAASGTSCCYLETGPQRYKVLIGNEVIS